MSMMLDEDGQPITAEQAKFNAATNANVINTKTQVGVVKSQVAATQQFNKFQAANPLVLGADSKNVENGDSSILDDISNATVATGASVLTSFWNTGVALSNSLGGDFDEVSADQFLKGQGLDDAANFYKNHKTGVDAAGLIVGSIIPGMAGIKAMKLAQAAMATSDIRLVAGLGRLGTANADIRAGVNSILAGSQKQVWTRESARLIARGGAQGALEGAAGSWAMLATMNQSPTLNEENLGYFDTIGKHLTTETALGAVFGGTLGAGFGALTYKGLARKAMNAIRGVEADTLQGIKAPNSFVTHGADGKTVVSLSIGDKIGYHAEDYRLTTNRIQELEAQNELGTITDTAKNVTLPALKQRQLAVNNEMRKQLSALSSDPNVQQFLQDTFANSAEGMAQAKSALTGAVNVRPAMQGVGTFRPSSLDLSEIAENMKLIPEVNVSDATKLDVLYGNDDFLKMIHTQSARYNDSAALGGDDFLTNLIAADAKVFGNSSGTGPINLRRAVVDMEQVSRKVNPERWKIIDDFQKKYSGMTAEKIQKMSDVEKNQYRAAMEQAVNARKLSEVFSDVHGALSTEGLGQQISKEYSRMTKYLNDNQLTGNYLKNNYSTIDTLTGKVYHQNILPTPADFGTPTLSRTATSQNLQFGGYSVPVAQDAFDLSGMAQIKSASAGGLGTQATSDTLKQLDEYAVKTNAQYVGAQMDKRFITNVEKENGKTVIGAEDLPYLDAALSSKASKFQVGDLPEMDREALTNYVRDLKSQKIREVLDANRQYQSSWSTEHLSRIFNTDSDFVELGASLSRRDIGQSSVSNLAEGKPRFLKVKYATDFDKTQPDVDTRWQTITTANKTAAQNSSLDVLGRLDTTLATNLADVTEAMPSVKSIATEQGTSYLGAANGAFNTYESRMQQIGQLINTAHHKVAQSIQATMLPLTQQILKDDLARAEIGVVVAKARSAKYVPGDGFSEIVQQVAPYAQQINDPQTLTAFMAHLNKLDSLAKEAASKGAHGLFVHSDITRILGGVRNAITDADPATLTPESLTRMFRAASTKLDSAKTDMFGIKSPLTANYLKGHMEINSKYVGMRTQIMNANGKVARWNPDELYFGAPDIKGKSVAFVESPPTASGERARHMIIANSAEERNAQMEIVRRDYAEQGYKVYSDPQMAEYKEALAKWEGGSWEGTPEFSAELQSKGVANNFFPRSDGQDAVAAVNDTIKRHTQLIRDSVETRYAEDFASLRGMEENWDTMYGKSQQGGRSAYLEDNPARKLRQIGLDMPQDSSKAISYLNSVVDNIADKTGRALENAFGGGRSLTMDDVDRINSVMKDAGLKTAYGSAAELALANSRAPSHLIRQFTATTNAFVSLGMHRLETMMSLVNAVGNTVLSVPLIGTVIRNLPDDVRMANFGVNNGMGVELSIPKFMAQSMREVMKDHKALFAKYEAMGIPVTHSRVYSQMMDTLVTEGDLTAGGIASKLTSQMNKMGDFAGKYNGSNILTGFNRLLNAHMGERLAQLSGATDGLAKASFINTFMNKVEGTMVSSQRPKFFQGVIGQAMGLFQSYNLHLMQQLTSNILDGNARASIQALAMNGTIFGMQSLPGWDELNHVVASHNQHGFGVDTYMNDAMGNDIGEWLTYGSLSNALHMGVFTRGRIELGFGLTGSLADKIPAVSILQNTLAGVNNTIGNMRQNGLTTDGMLEGLNTMGWNRPAAELAQRALGYTPNKFGDIVAYNQQSNNAFSNAWSVFGAALGAKQLDTAIATTQYYESKQRKAMIQDKLNNLGAKVKAATHNGAPLAQEDVESFAHKYSIAGGDLKNFQRWIISTSIRGQASRVESMRKGISSTSGQQAQALMGGAAPDLFNTTEDNDESY